jgi:hypothetical protein
MISTTMSKKITITLSRHELLTICTALMMAGARATELRKRAVRYGDPARAAVRERELTELRSSIRDVSEIVRQSLSADSQEVAP